MLLDTPICDFGWKGPSFNLPNADGIYHASEDLMGDNGLLVAFICNHCPYVHTIIDNLVTDATALQKQGITTVAIMSNDFTNYPDDAPIKMKEFAKAHNMNFPYLVDESQEVAKAYDAVCTPDFFGFNSDFELQYRGRLDNLGKGGIGERTPELLEAMQQVAQTSQGPKEQTPSMGCSLKWK